MANVVQGVSVAQKTRIRYGIVAMLFLVTAVNYADRATLSMAGTAMSKDLGLDAVAMGFIFSAFGWSYVIGQLPGGWLLDRFGSKRVYAASIFIWSVFTVLQGTVTYLSVSLAVSTLFALRFLVGLSEAPSFPANGRIVAAWFPAAERGTASAIFNSAQYFATVMFAPIMGWVTHRFGWPYVFYFMGAVGIVVSVAWMKTVYGPKDHPRISRAELDHIKEGGALVDMDGPKKRNVADEAATRESNVAAQSTDEAPKWAYVKQLLRNRMLLGVYIGQYCITTLTYFFLTWFPVYLVKERGMSILNAGFVAALPAVCGFIGGVLGGIFSDFLIRKGYSLTVARKVPIVVGMLLSTSMIACNYVDSSAVVVAIMAFAFFGKGLGALGWAVVADTSPKQIAGLSGGMFNTFGNIAAITTPIVIGYIVKLTGSFSGALVFVACNALVAIVSYLLIVGEIKRVQLK
ncbi:MFS transporter [Paraburkholderia sp. CNPSo 3157]|uniref:MFS transporter n=1 Tax=Paraburkholderia franconis TaxID=2654983 RepID=A0A7X1NFD4_9BURK|nr:MFS transporter [Paraburkholderia franconis]MPW20526.1 MFS transporter [Paraburkholderia franconis]